MAVVPGRLRAGSLFQLRLAVSEAFAEGRIPRLGVLRDGRRINL